MAAAMTETDLFVIGAGSAGVRAARVAAGLGARVTVAQVRPPTLVIVGEVVGLRERLAWRQQ